MENEWDNDRQPGDPVSVTDFPSVNNPQYTINWESATPAWGSGVAVSSNMYTTGISRIGGLPISFDPSSASWGYTIRFALCWAFAPLLIIWSKVTRRPFELTMDGNSSSYSSSSSSSGSER